jgi:ABC-type dipeptide/oligopeptide/nickel transport system permease subunit
MTELESRGGGAMPTIDVGPDPARIGPSTPATDGAVRADEFALVHEHGLEIKARSQWAYARKRFLRHRLAMASLIVLTIILLAGVFAKQVAPYAYDQQDFANSGIGPTLDGHHFFGTDVLGRDYFSRVVYGIQTSEKVAFLVAIVSTLIGTLIGSVAGYYGGWIDNLLMRFTDLVLVLPGLAILLTVAAFLGNGKPIRVAFILAFLFWTGLARIVRGSFLSLREKEFTEAALSFLGFGVQPPTPALGSLINEGQNVSSSMWWLVTFPGLTIVLIVLCINFIGDGLRDALDPTQRRLRA